MVFIGILLEVLICYLDAAESWEAERVVGSIDHHHDVHEAEVQFVNCLHGTHQLGVHSDTETGDAVL